MWAACASALADIKVAMMPSNGQIPSYANAAKDGAIEVWGRAWGGTAPYTATLDFGDGTAQATWAGQTEAQAKFYLGASHTYTTGGKKTVTLTVTDSLGASVSRQAIVNVINAPAHEDKINMAIEKSLLWLYKNKTDMGDGRFNWGTSGVYYRGGTGFPVLAFEENGHLPDNDVESDIYAETVQGGLNYILNNGTGSYINLTVHSDGTVNRDYDSNGNGKGASLDDANDHGTYAGASMAMALIMSQTSAAAAQAKIVNAGTANSGGPFAGKSYYEVVTDVFDLFGWAMGDGSYRGGYAYRINSTSQTRYDGSSQQWPLLAMAAGKDRWGLTVPEFVVTNGMYGFTYIQASGGSPDGGIGYSSSTGWRNVAKTGGALASFYLGNKMIGSDDNADRALAFVGRNWASLVGTSTGQDYGGWTGDLYSMYGVKKGLQLQGQTTISTPLGDRDWYQDLSAWLLGDASLLDASIGSNKRNTSSAFGQKVDGNWQSADYVGSYPAATAMGTLVLTKSVTKAVPVALINAIADQSCLRASQFQLNGTRSYHTDPSLSVSEYLWDFDERDGVDWSNPDATGSAVTVNPSVNDPSWRGNGSPTTRTITLRVKDNADPANVVTATTVVRLVNTDLAPVAVAIPAGVQPPVYTSRVGDLITIDGSSSYEPDADLGQTVVGYAWDLDGNGTYGDAADAALDQSGDATGVTATLQFNAAYSGQISLRVTSSSGGLTGTSATPINIYVAPSDLFVQSFDAANIQPGVSADLTAVLASDANSGSAANNVRVRFYNGDPLQGGTPLTTIPAGQDFVVTIPAAGQVTVSTTVALPANAEQVFVYVDSNDIFPEFNEQNNILGKNVRMTIVNEGLSMLPASLKVIAPEQLSTDDGGRSPAVGVVYTVITAPTGGTLLLDGTPLLAGGTFTQDDIAQGKLVYEQTVPGTVADAFDYSVALSSGEAVPQTTFAITVTPVETIGGLDGGPGNGDAIMVSISKDGRYVAFQSKSSNLVAVDTNGADDVFLHDRATGVTTLVSKSTAGVQGNAGSISPRISGDGRWIVFHSAANNLVAGDTNQKNDVFVHDRINGTTERVSLPDPSQVGTQGNGDSWYASISFDGNLIAYHSYANNLVAGDTMAQTDVFLHNRRANTTIRLSATLAGEGNNASTYPVVSADGSVVVFQSLATNLVPGDTNGRADVYAYDAASGQLALLSHAQDGVTLGNQTSVQPTVSENGRYVAFQSTASNLVPGDSNNTTDVFVLDRLNGTLTLASVNDAGVIGNSASSDARISDDGRYVTFHSNARNLSAAADGNLTTDIFVRDIRDQKTYRVNLAPDLSEAVGGASTRPDISGAGRYVAYISKASNLRTAANGVDQVYVTGFNSRPTITGIADQSMTEDTSTAALAFQIGDDMTPAANLDVTVTSSDTSIVDVANGGAVLAGNDANRTVLITPVADAVGPVTITVTVSDGSLSSSTSFLVTLTPFDDLPVAADDAYLVIEDRPFQTSFATGVLANDSDAETALASLTVSLVSGPSHAASFTLNPDGSWSYLGAANWFGTDSFTYVINDGTQAANSEPATVTLTVGSDNDLPVVAAESYGTSEDTALSVDAASGVLANDSDVEGALTATLVTPPDHGALTLQPNGSFEYVPDENYSGADSFRYRAIDEDLGQSSIVTVTITVMAVNDLPVLADKTYTVAEEFPLDVDAANGLLDGATDADGDPITVALVDGPSHGTLTLNPDGSFSYVPELNYYGPDSFRVTGSDGTGVSDPITVTINVTDEPDAPIATDDLYAMQRDGTLTISGRFGVLANDYDADGDELVAFLVVSPSYGTLELNEDGGFTYVPNAMFTGNDYFIYTANDGFADSEFGWVEINVHAPSNLPMGIPDAYTMTQDRVLTVPPPGVLANDVNPLGGAMTSALLTSPANGVATLNADGSLSYTPVANFIGVDTFTYVGTNADGSGSTNQISVIVQKAGMAPELVAPLTPQNGVYQNAFTWQIPVDAFTSPKGTPLIDDVSGLPPGLTFDPVTRTISGNPGDTGVYLVTVAVLDSVSPNFKANSFFTLTVDKAPLTVTANDAERLYGAANPALTVRYSGFLNGEDESVLDVLPTASTAADVLSNAGSYVITASGGSDNHYAITLVDGTLTVGKAPLVASAPAVTRLYGAANPALPVSYAGFVNGDDATDLDSAPVASTAAVASTPVGIHAVSLSVGSDGNYEIQNVAGTLEIRKAPLVATADDLVRPYGSANPSLTASYAGFVNGEDGSVLDLAPALSTTARVNSAVGNYPISIGGAQDGNYDISYVTGTLTVIKADSAVALLQPTVQPVFGRTAEISATVLPRGASGQVELVENNVVIATGTISRGRVTWTVSGLLGGPRQLTARYVGDDSYNPATSPVVQVAVAKTVSAIALRTSVNPAYHSYAVGLIATVGAPEVQTVGNPVQTGSVSFYDNGVLLGSAPVVNGAARLNVDSMAVGDHPLTARYNGDDNYLAANSVSLLQRVQKINPSVLLGSSASTVNYRDPVTLTVMIFPASATGTVTFFDGNTALGTVAVTANIVYGEAVLNTVSLGAGVRQVSARYNGDGQNSVSSSAILPITVRGAGRAPVAIEDFFNVFRNKSVVIPVQTLLMNDTDPDGDRIWFLTTGATTAAGAQVRAANGFINYTAPLNYVGVDTFTYVIEDGNGNQAVGTAQVSVTDSETISLVSIRDEGGVVTVRFLGSPGRVYTVEHQSFVGGEWSKRTNLTAPRRSINGLPLGVFEYTEPSGQAGFFRAVTPAY